MDVLEQIVNCDTDIVVRAGAGTGKTYALVEKYLSELVKPRENGFAGVDRLAAITFTEKAAVEMSSRVRQGLNRRIDELRIAMEIAPHDKISSANLEHCNPGWKENNRLLAHLVSQRQIITSAYISTIHSFCARILYEHPYTAGVDPLFEVIDEGQASTLLADCAKNLALERVTQGDEKVAKLMGDFGYSSYGGYGRGLIDYLLWIIPLIRAANRKPASLVDEHKELLETIDKEREPARERLTNMMPDLETTGNKNSKERKVARALRRAIETEPGDMTPAMAGEMLELACDLEKNRKDPVKYEKALNAAELMKKVFSYPLENALAEDMETFASLMEDILKAYNVEKEKRASLDFDDLQEKTCDLLRASPPILHLYKRKFARVLIDEFQDTNGLQKEIISLLAPPGEGRLFIVGDAKQSIYGFRGAEVELFEQVADQIESTGGAEFSLNQSWRATPELVDFNNDFFSRLWEDDPAAFKPARDQLGAERSGSESTSIVELMQVETDRGGIEVNRIAEANTIASKILEINDQVSYGDIAILLRTFSNHEIYESALRRANIPFQVVRGKGFYDSQEIKDFYSLLAFLDYSADRLAFLSTLRSPFVGLSDTALLELCRDDEGGPRDPAQLLLVGDIPKSMPAGDKDKLTMFKKRVTIWRELKDRVTISELLEMILSSTGYGAVMMSRQNGEQILANIFKLIELARAFETNPALGLTNFIVRLKTMLTQQPGEAKADVTGGLADVVKIMTVHQSKGLEFDAVFVADLGAKPNNNSGHIEFNPNAGIGMKYSEIETDKRYAGPMFRKVKATNTAAQERETKRLLYVAMTRARNRLYLSGPSDGKEQWRKMVNETVDAMKTKPLISTTRPDDEQMKRQDEKGETPSLVDDIVSRKAPKVEPVVEPLVLASRKSLQVGVTALASFAHCPRLYYYQHMINLPNVKPENSFISNSGGTSMDDISGPAIGARVHQLLETMPVGKDAPGDSLDKQLESKLADLPKSGRNVIKSNLEKAFSKKPLSGLMDTDNDAILREAPVIHKLVDKNLEITINGVVDLVWLESDGWKLVDYKYSLKPKDERRYAFQLKQYAHALMSVHSMEHLDTYLIYLREEDDMVSHIRFLPMDAMDLRNRTLNLAHRLARLDQAPEADWPVRDKEFCDEVDCCHRNICFVQP